MTKLATLNSFPNSTAQPAQQALTLQTQLPSLVHSIEQLQRSIPQPLTSQQIASTIRPLLIEQANYLDGQQKKRHAQLIAEIQKNRRLSLWQRLLSWIES